MSTKLTDARERLCALQYSIAVQHCSVHVVRSHGADFNANSSKHGTPLQCAVKREIAPLPIVRALDEAGVVIGFQDNEDDTVPSLTKH